MSKAMLVGGIAAGIGLTAAGAYSGYQVIGSEPAYAEVVSSEAITETYYTERQECRDEVVERQAAVKDGNQITGTAIGAVIGGVIGNQVGGGNGKKLATVAGAVAGGYAGKKVQQQQQANNTVSSVEQRCQTLQDPQQRVTGYRVSYRIGDETGTVIMAEQPDDRIPVKDGELVLASASSEQYSEQ
ncbi:glycine zipper 2TM domain-containing protein [Spongiibacter nanhainus]|uniref:Glycine zipper 2TM domain-containing protein n=1 Tax=Spongiibacter nanhainus TaxID=2794344 RepID=A0A7T4R0P3_9GAMM|nr:glycine zipper 2TM domain-containing protein [Spongiibacter nanhainus]QQD18169.1 glycine zipper 2TM domain-containing protein [Spongiibacter nanhainus]